MPPLRLLACAVLASLALVALPAQAQDSLRVRVAIRYKLGGAQPVGHTTFQLLDASANAILRGVYAPETAEEAERPAAAAVDPRAPITPRGGQRIGTPKEEHLQTYVTACETRTSLCGPGFEALRSRTVARGQTDLDGMVTFRDLEPGTYHVFGKTTTRGGEAVYWNRRVTVPARGTLELSDANAAAIY